MPDVEERSIEERRPPFKFGVFELNTQAGELLKRGIRLQLQQQPLRVLSILLERAGEVVTRDEIQKRLWPEETYLDFDNAINSAIRKLRDALGETAGSPRFIETLSRRGYRFIAPVSYSGLEHAPVLPEPATTQATSPRWWPLALAAVAMAAVGSGLWFANWKQQSVGGLLTAVPLTSYPGFEALPSFSPDGTRVAFTGQPPGSTRPDVYVKLLGPGEPVRLSSGGGFGPAWSRDGRFLAYLRPIDELHAAVIMIPAMGGQERELTRIAFMTNGVTDRDLWRLPAPFLAWSPDGKWLLTIDQRGTGYSAPHATIRVSVESGEKQNLLAPPPGKGGDGGDGALAIAPDGKTLAFTRNSSLWIRDIYVVAVAADLRPAGEPRRVTFDNKRIGGLAWTSDGQHLVFSSSRGGRAALWEVATEPGSKPVRLGLAGEEPSGDLAISSDGRQLVYAHSVDDENIWRASLKGDRVDGPGNFISSTRRDTQPQYSPDGQRIAFESDRSGAEEVWICQADGSNPVQLTYSQNAWAGTPRWSPDGEKIAFDADTAGNWDVYVVSARGGKPIRLTGDGAEESWPSWSGDGKWIYYFSTRGSHGQIWKMPATGGPEKQVTKHDGFWAVESADGSALYYATENALRRTYLRDGDDAQIVNRAHELTFAAVAKGLYFIEDVPADALKLEFFDFKTEKIKDLGALPGPLGFGMSVSPDGQSLLYGKHDRQGSDLMLIENFR